MMVTSSHPFLLLFPFEAYREDGAPQRRDDMKLAYNHELLIGFTTQTPYQSYETEVTPEQFRGYVRELSGTGIDILMCCPTAWRLPVYRSEVNRVWQTWGPNHKDPNVAADWKYFDRAPRPAPPATGTPKH